jgi:uncharacterized protein (TIGR00266 family)
MPGLAMQHDIVHGPAFALLRVRLDPGESLDAESGSMVTRSEGMSMRVRLNAGRKAGALAKVGAFVVALLRRFVGGETFFVNEFSAPSGGDATFAPTLAGAIEHRRLKGDRLILQAGAFLASTGDVDLKLRWGGLRALLSREGLFFLEASGEGDLFFSSYGGIEKVPVRGSYIVDTGHMVAFEGALDFRIRAPGGGAMGFVASGEGLVCEFTGEGHVYIQARNLSALVGWLTPYLPA